jgi:hypothetical protein
MSDTAAVRNFIKDHFNQDDFDALVFDFFPDVANEFTVGMTRTQRTTLLFQHCAPAAHPDRWQRLLGALERMRPEPYRDRLAGLEMVPAAGAAAAPTPTPPAGRDPRQIFLSHAHQDAALAQRLAADLRAEGWTIWMAPDSIRPGEMWAEAIERGLAESGIFLSLLSPAGVASRWVRLETNAAIAMEMEDRLRFLSLLIEPCIIPFIWRGYQWLDFTGGYDPAPLLATLSVGGDQGAYGEPGAHGGSPLPGGDVSMSGGVAAVGGGDAAGHDLYKAARDIHIHNYLAPAAATSPAAEPTKQQEPARPLAKPTVTPISRVEAPPPKQDVPPEHVPDSLARLDDGRYYHIKTGMEMVYVPAGPFLYGDKNEERNLPTFWIGRTPVTNAQYKRFLDENPEHRLPRTNAMFELQTGWYATNRTFPKGHEDYPVVLVSWEDADAFCRWAGLTMPAEERWEKAARGTDGRRYPWGRNQASAKLCYFNRKSGPTSIGRYSPSADSPFGCVDMAGNVWDWTATREEATGRYRIRGGSWKDAAWYMRSDYGPSRTPTSRDENIGFRCVMALA